MVRHLVASSLELGEHRGKHPELLWSEGRCRLAHGQTVRQNVHFTVGAADQLAGSVLLRRQGVGSRVSSRGEQGCVSLCLGGSSSVDATLCVQCSLRNVAHSLASGDAATDGTDSTTKASTHQAATSEVQASLAVAELILQATLHGGVLLSHVTDATKHGVLDQLLLGSGLETFDRQVTGELASGQGCGFFSSHAFGSGCDDALSSSTQSVGAKGLGSQSTDAHRNLDGSHGE